MQAMTEDHFAEAIHAIEIQVSGGSGERGQCMAVSALVLEHDLIRDVSGCGQVAVALHAVLEGQNDGCAVAADHRPRIRGPMGRQIAGLRAEFPVHRSRRKGRGVVDGHGRARVGCTWK